jgi:hypothetical protein
VLFERRLREGIHSGEIVLAFRRWQRPQVIAGHRYRTGQDLVVAERVDVVQPSDIDAVQAAQAGYPGPAELLADLRGSQDAPLYRIRFRRLDEPDPRDRLAAAAALSEGEAVAIAARLDRMDRLSSRGPWTHESLRWIADHPATSSALLAAEIGWPRPDLKARIRRLKELGLTRSLETGYELTPRGSAVLRALGPGARRIGAAEASRGR